MSEIRIQKNETEELQKKDAGADFESFRQIIETCAVRMAVRGTAHRRLRV